MPSDREVFLCYASDDLKKAEEIYKLLTEADFNVWFDKTSLPVGAIWEDEIYSAIDRADKAMVLLSPASVKKIGFVQREIARIVRASEVRPERSTFVLPLRLDDVMIPSLLTKWHTLDITHDSDWPGKLMRTLDKD